MEIGKNQQAIYSAGIVTAWMGTVVAAALILRGTPYFGQLLPILFGAAFWCMVIIPGFLLREPEKSKWIKSMESKPRAYLIGAIIVWIGTIVGAALILHGTSYFGQFLPILGWAACWCTVFTPRSLLRGPGEFQGQHSPKEKKGIGAAEQFIRLMEQNVFLFGLLGFVGLLGIALQQPTWFVWFLFFGFFAPTVQRPAHAPSHPR